MSRNVIDGFLDRQTTWNHNDNYQQLFNGDARIESKFDSAVDDLNVKVDRVADPNQFIETVTPTIEAKVEQSTTDAFNTLSASQQGDGEVVLARQGFDTLTDRVALNSQVDFVSKLESLTNAYGKGALTVVNATNQQFKFVQPINALKAVAYWFIKDGHDDYITMLQGEVGDYVNTPQNVSYQNLAMTDSTQFITANPPNYYTTTVGATLKGEFTADRVDLIAYTNNQGGIWEATLDKGTPNQKVTTVSTYTATATPENSIKLFDGLEWTKHTIELVFKGQDPANPVTGARGWFYYGGTAGRPQDSKGTLSIQRLVPIMSNVKPQLYSYSNKEFAFEVRDAIATSGQQYVPEHNATGSAFKNSDAKVLVDGKQIEWIGNKIYADVDHLQVIQDVNGRVGGVDLLNVVTTHSIKNGTVAVSGYVKAIRDTYFTTGYVGMIPYFTNEVTQIKTSLGNVYAPILNATAETKNRLISDDLRASSYAITNTTDDIVSAMTFDDFITTMRINENSAKGDTWIEDRSADMGKIYNQQFKEETLSAGKVFVFKMRYKTTVLPLASKLL